MKIKSHLLIITPILKKIGSLALFSMGGITSGLLSLFLLPFFTENLSVVEFGKVTFYMSLVTFISCFSLLGLNTYTLKEVYYKNNKKEQIMFYCNMFLFIFVWNVILCLISYPLLLLIVPALFPEMQIHPYLIIVLFSMLASSLMIIPVIILRVSQKPLFYGLITTGAILMSQCLSVIFVMQSPFGYSKMLGACVSSLFVGGGSLIVLLYYGKKYSKKYYRLDFAEIKKGVIFGYPLILTSILTYLASSFDALLIGWFLAPADLGIYGVALTISAGITVVLYALYQLTEPDFFRIATDEENFKKSGFANLLLKVCSIITLLGTIICLFIIPLGQFLIRRAEFASAVSLLPMIAGAIILRSCNSFSLIGITALGKTRIYPVLTAVKVIFVISCEIIGIKIMGISGVPMGMFVGETLYSFVILVIVTKRYAFNIQKAYRFLLILISCLFLVFGTFLFPSQYPSIVAAIISSLFMVYLSCGRGRELMI
ncbi:MAG TPA: oligosaccharide flippase family protein [Paludibacter sp.]|nr:oligosaccharide flippase family protein [Paludibacter sp.]